MFLTVLNNLIVVSGFLTISAERNGLRLALYIFKPLTVLLITLLALQAKYPVSNFYRRAIVIGLLFSLLGDIFLMLPRDRFLYGLVSFAVAHIFYIAAFAHESGWAISVWSAIPLLLYGALMLKVLSKHLGKLRVPVIIYMLVILMMGCLAVSRWIVTAEAGSALAASGALFFIASDSLLAVDRFKGNLRHSHVLILGTYFIAQWLIALST